MSAGGTGGHLFPAQSLAEALPDWEILFVAGGLSTSRYFNREIFRFEEIPCATFSLTNPLQICKGLGKICSGIKQSSKILKKFNPDVVIGFGSFFTLPVLAAAAFMGKPTVIHEQNAVLGKVNRLFAPWVHTTAITFPITRSYLKGKTAQNAVEVVFPQRKRSQTTNLAAWEYFGLTPCEKPLLLVFGGSQGATRLNILFLEALPRLTSIQVLHFTGNENQATQARTRYQELGIAACVKPFEPRMDLAMRIADCGVTRAGAATVCELIAHNLPAVLVPFPFATENHQEKNGEHFVSIVKGGKMYKENELDAALLAACIVQQLADRAIAKDNIKAYKQQRRAIQLADLIQDIA